MADLGHQETEKILKELENRIADEYRTAVRDMQKKLKDYQEQTEAQRLIQKQLFSQGKITQKEYTDWCFRHMMMGKRWEQMLDVLTKDMHHANEIALKMAKDTMPDVYALNANYATYQIEHDGRIDTSFVLYNHDTAEYLLGDERQLMPGPSTRKAREIAANKDMQWNKQKIQSSVLQGVLQGESPYDVAKRLMQVGQMNYNSAVRYARTMTTSAQNAGRYEAYRRADKLGVDLTIEWQATLDNRTRHEHRMMHGQRRNVDEPFETPDGYTIMYPADCTGTSTAPQSEIWNCRCTLLSWVKGFEGDTVKSSPKKGDMTFEEWRGEKEQPTEHNETVVRYGELFSDKAAEITDRTMRLMDEQYPINEPLSYVGDVRVHRGLEEDLEALDLHDEHPELTPCGAQYIPVGNAIDPDGRPFIEIHDESLSLSSLSAEFEERYSIREKYGFVDEIPSMREALDTVSHTLEGSIIHERAHAYADSVGFFMAQGDNEVREFLVDFWKTNHNDLLTISRYAASSPDEMFAEAVVQTFDTAHSETRAFKLAQEIVKGVKGRIR